MIKSSRVQLFKAPMHINNVYLYSTFHTYNAEQSAFISRAFQTKTNEKQEVDEKFN